MNILKIIIIGIFCLSLSCVDDVITISTNYSTIEAGFVKGTVINAKGEPLSGVKIYVDNSIFYNSGISGTTDAEGHYKIKTPQGSWKVYAEMPVTYNSVTYKVELDPGIWESFAGVDGAIRNFTWSLTGEKPFNPGSYFGGLVKIFKDPDSDIYDVENIEFTFTPVGNLIDGSQGQTITRKCGAPQTDFYSLIHDIPIGRYQITAKYLTTGQQLKLHNDYFYNQPYETAPTLDFFGQSSGANCTDCMYLAYSELY